MKIRQQKSPCETRRASGLGESLVRRGFGDRGTPSSQRMVVVNGKIPSFAMDEMEDDLGVPL